MNIHLKTALNNIRRSPFQALAAVFVLFVTFFVSSVLIIFIYTSHQLLKYYETRPQIIVFLKDDALSTDIDALKTQLEGDPRAKKITYVTKEQALEIYKKATKDNPLLSELVSPSVFPASLEFSVTDLSYAEPVISEIKTKDIVDEIGYTASLGGEDSLTDVVSRLRQIAFYIRLSGGIFIGFLLGTSLVLMVVIISMKMSTRKSEIEILDLIGAVPSFIRAPVLLEALLYTVAGVVAGWFVSLLLVLYLTPSLMNYFKDIPILPTDTLKLLGFFGLILAVEIFTGLMLSLAGSVLAVARARKRK
jgi:cell division transport system permease protein